MKFGMKNNGRIRDTHMFFFFLSSVTGVVVSVLRRIEDYVSCITDRISDYRNKL